MIWHEPPDDRLLLEQMDSEIESLSRERMAWHGMIRRCSDADGNRAHYYIEKGVSVCQRWLDSFNNFLQDVGRCPEGKTSIDRFPNGNGNYEPGNVRWATAQEQARNRISNRILTLNGVSHCVAEWSEIIGIKPKTIYERLQKGATDEEALTTPVGPSQKGKLDSDKIKQMAEMRDFLGLTFREIGERFGVTHSAARRAVQREREKAL